MTIPLSYWEKLAAQRSSTPVKRTYNVDVATFAIYSSVGQKWQSGEFATGQKGQEKNGTRTKRKNKGKYKSILKKKIDFTLE